MTWLLIAIYLNAAGDISIANRKTLFDTQAACTKQGIVDRSLIFSEFEHVQFTCVRFKLPVPKVGTGV